MTPNTNNKARYGVWRLRRAYRESVYRLWVAQCVSLGVWREMRFKRTAHHRGRYAPLCRTTLNDLGFVHVGVLESLTYAILH